MQINHHLVVGKITYQLNSPIGLDLRRPLEIGFFGARFRGFRSGPMDLAPQVTYLNATSSFLMIVLMRTPMLRLDRMFQHS